ncbi:MAG: hypothetical protein SFX19_08765 [Alphaproteobacteria bacterium]|nr:hypothetical protein [Alphaproteobacteria bacterium]
MKNIKYTTLKYIALVVIALILGGYAKDYSVSLLSKRGSANFIMSAAKAMSANWDSAELDMRAHPILMGNLNKAKQSTTEYFDALKRLGSLKKGTCDLITMATLHHPESSISAAYKCEMTYDHAPAIMSMEVRRDSVFDDWKIVTLNVDSPIFAQSN